MGLDRATAARRLDRPDRMIRSDCGLVAREPAGSRERHPRWSLMLAFGSAGESRRSAGQLIPGDQTNLERLW